MKKAVCAYILGLIFKNSKANNSQQKQPKSTQNGVGGYPKSTTNRPKMGRNTPNHPKWLPDGSQDPLDQCPSLIFTNFWVSSGTPKSTKNPFLAKKGAPGNAFLPVLVANAAFLDFLADFCRFLVKSRCKNRCMFLHLLVFFSNWRPSRNIVFYGTKATFSIFEFSIFSEKKNDQKWSAKLNPEKSSKKLLIWDPKWSQNR